MLNIRATCCNVLIILYCALLIINIIIIVIIKHYSPLWTVASNTLFLHSERSLTIACPFYIIIFKPSSTSSLHLLRGLFLFLVPLIVPVAICFGILWFCILSTRPHRLSQTDFIYFAVYLPPVICPFLLFIFC